MKKKYYTRSEAEKFLNLTAGRIKQILRSGELKGSKVQGVRGEEWRIDVQSLLRYNKKLTGKLPDNQKGLPGNLSGKKTSLPDNEPKLPGNQKKLPDNERSLLDRIIEEKDKQIKFSKEQLKVTQDQLKQSEQQKERLIELHEQKEFRKDILLKETLGQLKQNEDVINKYKILSNNIIKSIEYAKEKTIELIDTGKKRIAIIEDEEDQANILKLNLEKSGYDVFIFSNVSEASKYYIKNAFYLTLLDLNLEKTEKISGEKFFEVLRKFQKETPVIIISGETEERIKRAVQDTGAIDYFKKPLNIDQLINKVGVVLKNDNGKN